MIFNYFSIALNETVNPDTIEFPQDVLTLVQQHKFTESQGASGLIGLALFNVYKLYNLTQLIDDVKNWQFALKFQKWNERFLAGFGQRVMDSLDDLPLSAEGRSSIVAAYQKMCNLFKQPNTTVKDIHVLYDQVGMIVNNDLKRVYESHEMRTAINLEYCSQFNKQYKIFAKENFNNISHDHSNQIELCKFQVDRLLEDGIKPSSIRIFHILEKIRNLAK